MNSLPTEAFLRESAHYLGDVYLPRLERAVAAMPADELWWRPHEKAIALGTILLHLEGNVRQWILSGLGGDEDRRDRAAEFAAEGGPGAASLLEALRATVQRACGVIAALDPEGLTEPRVIQGTPTSALAAVYHVVEHFSWHAGQAVWIAKARGGPEHGIAFYDDDRVNRARNA